MTNEEKREKNILIAKMLGWIYISSLDVKSGKYHNSIKAGWYSAVPAILSFKVNGKLYKCRSHNELKFDYDWNWLIEAVEFIENLGYIFVIDNLHCYYYKDSLRTAKSGFGDSKKEAVFIAVSKFAENHLK